MGCAPSGSVRERSRSVAEEHEELAEWLDGLVNHEDPHSMLAAYIEIERSIVNEESESPASALSLALSRQQHIKTLMETASDSTDQNGRLVSQDNSIHELFIDLGLHRGSSVAAEHEEFIANVNRRALNLHMLDMLGKRSTEVEEAIRVASLKISKLQILYEKQDLLLGRIYGEVYGSEKEKLLEEEIDRMRNYRDAFSNGAYHWQDTAKNVGDAAELLLRGVEAWHSVQNQRSMERKISMAAEARNAIQEAAVLVQMSQDSMPGVQFPYCTKRELTAITQAIEYIFTDVLIEDRYRHALQVYKNFQERAAALRQWINQILNSSLKKDLLDIDRGILGLSKRLRQERINIICDKLGIDNKYSTFGLNPAVNNIRPVTSDKLSRQNPLLSGGDFARGKHLSNVSYGQGKDMGRTFGFHNFGGMMDEPSLHVEFEKNLAARRNTMWPSRRIEELHMMALNNSESS